jgi:hypothetical protein
VMWLFIYCLSDPVGGLRCILTIAQIWAGNESAFFRQATGSPFSSYSHEPKRTTSFCVTKIHISWHEFYSILVNLSTIIATVIRDKNGVERFRLFHGK